MSEFPVGRSSQQAFFKAAEPETAVRKPSPELTPNTCRWCLRRFDPHMQQPRTTWERGQLRTHLHMADNGSELVICDNCWSGANGEALVIHGQVVPCIDPNVIPNPLLRSLVEG